MGVDGFTNGKRSGADIVANDCGPLDIVTTKVREILAADTTLANFFHAIKRYDQRPDWIFGGLPQLHIYPGAWDPTRSPTEIEMGEVEVVVGIRSEAGELKPLDDFECGWSAILRAVQQVLRDNTQLADSVTGTSVVLAHTSRPGPFSIALDVEQDSRRRAIHREISWIYKLRIDDNTGQLEAFS